MCKYKESVLDIEKYRLMLTHNCSTVSKYSVHVYFYQTPDLKTNQMNIVWLLIIPCLWCNDSTQIIFVQFFLNELNEFAAT